MYVHTPVPQNIVDKLGEICLVLPEVYEEEAWVGRRWMVHKKNFAHVLMIHKGYPPTYARVAKIGKSNEPVCVLTFRTPMSASEEPLFSRKPYFLPGWWANIVGMEIDAQTDWDRVVLHLASCAKLQCVCAQGFGGGHGLGCMSDQISSLITR